MFRQQRDVGKGVREMFSGDLSRHEIGLGILKPEMKRVCWAGGKWLPELKKRMISSGTEKFKKE